VPYTIVDGGYLVAFLPFLHFSNRNHPQIAWKISPVPIRLSVNVNAFLRVQMDKIQDDNALTQKSRLSSMRNQGLD
jgi:hypothetical protein